MLLSFNPEVFLLRFTEDQDLIKFIIQKVIRSKLWLELDRGTLSIESARQEFLKQFSEKEAIITAFFDGWMEILIPIPENVEILKNLKEEGYDCYYLSNFIKEAFPFVNNKYGFFSHFNGGIISSLVKAIKPEMKIYTSLLEKYELVA